VISETDLRISSEPTDSLPIEIECRGCVFLLEPGRTQRISLVSADPEDRTAPPDPPSEPPRRGARTKPER
jgi:hypothetical protein